MSEPSDKKHISVGEGITAADAAWSFSGPVAETFSTHIERSVPLYREGHNLICKVSDFFVNEGSVCYEIGISVGDLIQKLAAHCPKKNVKWIGLDAEKEMIKKARKNLGGLSNVELLVEDVNLFEFDASDFIVSYYTIQFIHPKYRQKLVNKIYASLEWGGAFVFFEKIRGNDARFQDVLTALYAEFKIDNGYSSEQLLNKSRSLKGILEPFSYRGNMELLNRAGFQDIQIIMSHTCFQGYLAIK